MFKFPASSATHKNPRVRLIEKWKLLNKSAVTSQPTKDLKKRLITPVKDVLFETINGPIFNCKTTVKGSS